MANLSRDKAKVKKVEAKIKPALSRKPIECFNKGRKLESFDMSHIKVNFFDLLKAMHTGNVNTVLDTSTGDPVIVTSKMYQQLLKVA